MGTMDNAIAPIGNIKFDIEVALGIISFDKITICFFWPNQTLKIFVFIEQQLGAQNLPFPGMDSKQISNLSFQSFQYHFKLVLLYIEEIINFLVSYHRIHSHGLHSFYQRPMPKRKLLSIQTFKG